MTLLVGAIEKIRNVFDCSHRISPLNIQVFFVAVQINEPDGHRWSGNTLFVLFCQYIYLFIIRIVHSGDSRTFSLGCPWGAMVFGRGHSTGTTTGLLLRTIPCKSLVLMPEVKFIEKYTKHAC